MDWHQLAKKKVVELRDMAKQIPEVGAVTGMGKEQLIDLVAKHRGIERPHRVVEGIDKTRVKAEIRELKKQRQAALEAKDKAELVRVRREIHRRKRALRRASHLI